MLDIKRSTAARPLGMISGRPRHLANEALRVLKELDAPITVYVDEHGMVLALPALGAADRSVEEMIGTYFGRVRAEDIADDIRASAGPRLAAIGILVNGYDARA